jgi:hypothetical protein
LAGADGPFSEFEQQVSFLLRMTPEQTSQMEKSVGRIECAQQILRCGFQSV